MRSCQRGVAVALLLLACSPANSPPAPQDELRGAWRITEHSTTVDSQSVINRSPQSSLFVFADQGYYSMMYVVGEQSRGLFVASTAPTDSEKIAAYDSFVANSGRYERVDSNLVRPIVAKSPNFMAGDSQVFSVRLLGDTLWLTTIGGFAATGDVRRLERVR